MKSVSSVTILNQYYPPDYAATGQFISDLAEGFAERGHKVEVITSLPAYAYGQSDAACIEHKGSLTIRRSRVTRFAVQRIRGKLVGGLVFLARALVKLRHRALRGDLLILTTAPGFLGILGPIYRFLCAQRYAVILYDLYPDVAVELGVAGPRNPLVMLWNQLNRVIWKHAESLIVLTDEMKDRVAKADLSLLHKTHVIHNWADTNALRPVTKNNCEFAKAHGYDKKFVVQYSGNLGRAHDFETILDSVKLLKAERTVRFCFIGNGFGMSSLRKAAEAGGLENCDFHDYQPEEKLADSLSSADVALVSILPAMRGVVAPSKVYGILAVGRPILAICSSTSYLGKLVRREDCGVHILNNHAEALAAAILSLSRNPARTSVMGRNARRAAETLFHPDSAISAYCDAFGMHRVSRGLVSANPGRSDAFQSVAENSPVPFGLS